MNSSGNQVYIGMPVNIIVEEEYTIQTGYLFHAFWTCAKVFQTHLTV